MAYQLDFLRQRDRYEELMRRLAPERPVIVERGDPFHIYNDFEFVKRYRLSKRTTLLVIDDIADNLRRLRSDGIPVHIQLLTVLRFYAVGKFDQSLRFVHFDRLV